MTALPQAAEAALDAAFLEHPLSKAPAALAAVFDRDGIVAWKGAGSPWNDDRGVTRGTVFRIASMSKSFLAAAALALRDEGRLDFGSPVTDYVPGIRFLLHGEAQRVTIHHLLSNSSGMVEDNAWGDRRLGDSREVIEALGQAGLPLAAEPGDRYQYSNLGMSFVGRAIERVTGRSVEEEITRRFIEPLGLSGTRYTPEEYPLEAPPAAGFRTFDDGARFIAEPYVGHGALACIGGLFSTLDDVARWASFLGSAFTSEPSDVAVLSPASRREMQRAHTVTPVAAPSRHRDLEASGYGLGLVAEYDRRLGRIAQHSGGLPGFSSHMRWHLPSGIGAIAFGNADGFSADRLAIHALSETLRGARVPSVRSQPWPATFAAAERLDAALAAGRSLAEASGVLSSNVFQDIPLRVREERLSALALSVGAVNEAQRPLAERIVPTEDPSALRWRLACEQGQLDCAIQLVGLHEPLVESLTISVVVEVGTVVS